MTNHFGSTKMPTQRDKRKQSRKLYRQIRRGWRDAASEDHVHAAPHSPTVDSDANASKAAPPCALSNEHAEDDAESDSKRCANSPRHTAGHNGGGAPSKKIMTKASRLERAAQRRIARLERCSQSSLSPLDNCVLLEIATYMPAQDLHTLLRVNRRWRWTLQAHDSFLWKPYCTEVWSGRFISRPELLPFVQSVAAALQPDAEARPASPTTDGPVEFGCWEEKPPQSWREALCRSIVHGRSTTLSSSELAAGSWQISFKLDPTIPPQRIQFYSTPTPHVRTPGFPQMPWALYQGGTVLHVHVFPEQAVTRDATTWMWSMHNRFVGIGVIPTVLAQRPIIASNVVEYLPLPFVPSPPAATQPPSDSENSDVAETADLHTKADPDQPYATDPSDTDAEPCPAADGGTASAVAEVSESLMAELQRFLSKPREVVGRGRSLPVVSGHGGDCDGEDPPPTGVGAAAATPCAHSDASSDTTAAAECGAGRRCSAQDSGTTFNIQQVGSRLSMATSKLFDAIMHEEYASCARSKELGAFQALGTVRLLDHAPRRMRLNFPAHLLDQGHPRKPP